MCEEGDRGDDPATDLEPQNPIFGERGPAVIGNNARNDGGDSGKHATTHRDGAPGVDIGRRWQAAIIAVAPSSVRKSGDAPEDSRSELTSKRRASDIRSGGSTERPRELLIEDDNVSTDQNKSRSPLVMGLVFAALVIGANMLFTESTRSWMTQSLRSPNGKIVREAFMQLPALQDAGQLAYMDSDSFIRLRLASNFALLGALFFWLGFMRKMGRSGVRLSFRLLFVMAGVYIGILVFDPIALGQNGSAIQWFQSAGFVACATAAILNFFLVKSLTSPDRQRGTVALFWLFASVACLYAALDTRFDITVGIASTLQANIARFGNLNVYSRLGMPLWQLAGPIIAVFCAITAALFARTLRSFYASVEFDWHKPFVFAIFLNTAAALTILTPSSASITPWLSQVASLADTTVFVIVLAAFFTTAVGVGQRLLIGQTLGDSESISPSAAISPSPSESRVPNGPPRIEKAEPEQLTRAELRRDSIERGAVAGSLDQA